MIGAPSARELIALRFALDARGRITGTNEPPPRGPAPRMTLIRTATDCAWAVRDDVSDKIAAQIAALAADEQPQREPRDGPEHVARYHALLGGSVDSGPTFLFPDSPPSRTLLVVELHTLEPLQRHFRGWTAGEIPERGPIAAICDGDDAVCVCFCARRSETAAEAGVETARDLRGRGYAPLVTAVWGAAVRASGRTPLYSTSWPNAASLAVARKLALVPYANELNVVD